jgi:hypothetical protein
VKKIKVIYNPKRICGCDPLALKNTIAVKAEVAGEEYGFFLELEDEESTVENIVQALQVCLDSLEELEREVNQ